MNIGVIIDNDLNHDSRVLKQINLLKKKIRFLYYVMLILMKSMISLKMLLLIG